MWYFMLLHSKGVVKMFITLFDEIINRAKETKKIDEFERYVDMFIELYINTIGGNNGQL